METKSKRFAGLTENSRAAANGYLHIAVGMLTACWNAQRSFESFAGDCDELNDFVEWAAAVGCNGKLNLMSELEEFLGQREKEK